MYKRMLGAMVATAVMALTLLGASATPALASGRGATAETQWTGLAASTWTGEVFINGDPRPVAVVLTNLSNEAVFTFTDDLSVYVGQYDWDHGGWDMAW